MSEKMKIVAAGYLVFGLLFASSVLLSVFIKRLREDPKNEEPLSLAGLVGFVPLTIFWPVCLFVGMLMQFGKKIAGVENE